MAKTIHIWTVQIAKWRDAEKEGLFRLDTTAKSGIKAFAPDFNNVMLYKSGNMSAFQYTDAYNRRMRDSRTQFPRDWKALKDNDRVAVMCYCKAGEFCHRHIFAQQHMKPYLEAEGFEVILHGELNYKGPPPPMYDVETQPVKNVITFFKKWDMLSNFAPLGFTVKGVHFKHVEQFMMYCKAKYMGDEKIAAQILAEDDPFECKKLGRRVKPYLDDIWREKRRTIVFKGCLQKAREHESLRTYLISTYPHRLAEANPDDTLWGTGLSKDDPRINDPAQWLGENLLGGIWEEIRSILMEDVIF